jgi:hypothetical protein
MHCLWRSPRKEIGSRDQNRLRVGRAMIVGTLIFVGASPHGERATPAPGGGGHLDSGAGPRRVADTVRR